MNVDLINNPKMAEVVQKMKHNIQIYGQASEEDAGRGLDEDEKSLMMIYHQAMMVSMITTNNFAEKWLKDDEKADEINGYMQIDYDKSQEIYHLSTIDTVFKHPQHNDVISMHCKFDNNEKYSVHLTRLDPQ